MSETPISNNSDAKSPQPVLQMRNITKRFAGVIALNDVSLDVFPGEVLAVIGENGAGKSTLMKILGGVHQPSGGTILINGSPVQIKTVRDAIVNGISFIHQELNNLDNVDVAGNVFLGREPRKLGPLAILDNAKMHADATNSGWVLARRHPCHT
jgi:ribose transport system ATP-binding protein